MVTLEYDFLKHITSLSLVAIGGALTFAGSIFAAAADKSRLWLGSRHADRLGHPGLFGQQRLLKLLRTDQPVGRSVSLYREAAVLVFGFGTGTLVAFAYTAITSQRPAPAAASAAVIAAPPAVPAKR